MVALRCIIALFYETLMEIHYPAPESLVTLVWGQVQIYLNIEKIQGLIGKKTF